MTHSRIKLMFVLSGFLIGNSTFAQWSKHITPAIDNLYAIEAVTNDIIFAGGYAGSLVKTTDGGTTWSNVPTGTYGWVNKIHFFNTSNGWLVTQSGNSSTTGDIMKTTDGGATWTSVHGGYDYSSMFWLSNTVAYVGTWTGEILKTTDGGSSWNIIATPSTENTVDIQFLDASNGYAVTTGNKLLKTIDGGVTWTTIYRSGIRSIAFLDVNTGFYVDDYGKIGKTTDGGANFTTETTPYPGYKILDIYFHNSTQGFAIGGLDCSNGSCTPNPVILSTNDGGQTWIDHTNHPVKNENIAFYEIDIAPNGTAFMAGSDKVVMHNSNALSVDINSSEIEIVISPNPNNGQFSLLLPNSANRVQIVNSIGKVVYTEQARSRMKISMEEVSAGIYFVSVFDDKENVLTSRKVLVR